MFQVTILIYYNISIYFDNHWCDFTNIGVLLSYFIKDHHLIEVISFCYYVTVFVVLCLCELIIKCYIKKQKYQLLSQIELNSKTDNKIIKFPIYIVKRRLLFEISCILLIFGSLLFWYWNYTGYLCEYSSLLFHILSALLMSLWYLSLVNEKWEQIKLKHINSIVKIQLGMIKLSDNDIDLNDSKIINDTDSINKTNTLSLPTSNMTSNNTQSSSSLNIHALSVHQQLNHFYTETPTYNKNNHEYID